MENREWLYYLLNKNGLSYYRKNGLNVLSSRPKPLKYTPDGWQDINIGYERSLETWGNNRNFSLPQNLVLDGAEILRELFHTKNIEEIVYLLIQKQRLIITPTEYYFFHKYFYRGELDLSTVKDGDTKVTVNIMEGGLYKNYKAYSNTKFEIDPEDLIIKMDGIVFRGSKRFVVIEATYNHGIDSAVKEMIPMTETTSEGSFFNWYFASEAGSTTDADYDFIQGEDLSTSIKNNGQVVADSSVSFHMEGTIFKHNTLPFAARVGFDVILETDTGRTFTLFTMNHEFPAPGTEYFFSLDSPVIDLLKDEKFFIYQTPNAFQNSNQWDYLDDVRFEYQTRDIPSTTYIKAKRAIKVYADLTDKVLKETSKAVSAVLTDNQNYVISCGDAVRGLEGAVIKTSLDAFRKAINVIENIGIGIINNKIYLERKAFFLKDENVIPLGQCKKVDIEEANEVLGSNISLGYNHNDSDDVNGIYSFNNTSVYTTPITRVTTDIEITTDYITDPYVIELYRANLEGKETTDDNKDNSVIILNIDIGSPQTLSEDTQGLPAGTVYYNLKRETYDVITGVVDTSKLYNIADLTPARLMAKHMPYFDSLMYGFEGQELIFQTTDKNRDLYTKLGTQVYDEDANIKIGNTVKLFKPLFFNVTPEASNEIIELLESNPNGCFSFIHDNGLTYRGFNIKIGIAANSLEEQAFKLLAVADQDLTTLKNR